MHIYIEIKQPIINDIFTLKPIFFRSLSFTTGGRTWRFGCILAIKGEEKSSIQSLYHLKFLITFGCTAYRGAYILLRLYLEGNLRLQIDWASL